MPTVILSPSEADLLQGGIVTVPSPSTSETLLRTVPRTHRALGALFAYSVWRHLPSQGHPKVSFGKRANVYPGIAPLQDILPAEVAGKRINEVQKEELECGELGEESERWQDARYR